LNPKRPTGIQLAFYCYGLGDKAHPFLTGSSSYDDENGLGGWAYILPPV